MAKLIIQLSDDERDALYVLAQHEYREMRFEAALIIHQELERRGLLVGDPNCKREAAHSMATKEANNDH